LFVSSENGISSVNSYQANFCGYFVTMEESKMANLNFLLMACPLPQNIDEHFSMKLVCRGIANFLRYKQGLRTEICKFLHSFVTVGESWLVKHYWQIMFAKTSSVQSRDINGKKKKQKTIIIIN